MTTKSKTKYNYFEGTLEYFRNNRPDDYGNYSIKIKLDDDSLIKYKESGIQVTIDEENCVFFRRPDSKVINKELVELGPAIVVDTDGNELKKLPGKGSKIVAKVRSYNTVKGVGHTLDAIQVIELVPVELSLDGTHRNF